MTEPGMTTPAGIGRLERTSARPRRARRRVRPCGWPWAARRLLVRLTLALAPLSLSLVAPLTLTQASGPPQHTTPSPEAAYTATLHGQVVQFGLHGLEPDFDPIYGLVLSLTLHDTRPAALALPDATLVLDLYLEQFQPDTTPLLPDLLHPNQTATNLVGFMQGPAVLVNRGGHIAYQGDALAEVFGDNTLHLVLLHLQPPGVGTAAPATASGLLMQGTVRLARGGAQSGSLRALGPLARTALAVPPGPVLPWQAVVRGLRVPLPRMLGTAGTGHAAPGGPPAPSFAPVPATAHAPAHTASGSRLLAVLLTLLLAGLALLVWRRPAWPARRRALAAPAGEGVVAGPATDVARST